MRGVVVKQDGVRWMLAIGGDGAAVLLIVISVLPSSDLAKPCEEPIGPWDAGDQETQESKIGHNA